MYVISGRVYLEISNYYLKRRTELPFIPFDKLVEKRTDSRSFFFSREILE